MKYKNTVNTSVFNLFFKMIEFSRFFKRQKTCWFYYDVNFLRKMLLMLFVCPAPDSSLTLNCHWCRHFRPLNWGVWDIYRIPKLYLKETQNATKTSLNDVNCSDILENPLDSDCLSDWKVSIYKKYFLDTTVGLKRESIWKCAGLLRALQLSSFVLISFNCVLSL